MARPTLERCKRGHNIAVAGRYGNGMCRQCAWSGRPQGRPAGWTKRYCRDMHDTWVVGRYANGTCRECQRLANLRVRTRAADGMVPARRLLTYAKDHGLSAVAADLYAARFGVTRGGGRKAWSRLQQSQRITIDCADHWCLALGTFLSLEYPELYCGGDVAAEVSA